jgi:DNA-binding MarR family transcriptional regulator
MQEEGSRITDLAARVKITKQSMSTLVYQLEEWGYLERRPDPTDKRAVLFAFTEKGREVRKLGRALNYEFEQKWAGKLGPRNSAGPHLPKAAWNRALAVVPIPRAARSCISRTHNWTDVFYPYRR